MSAPDLDKIEHGIQFVVEMGLGNDTHIMRDLRSLLIFARAKQKEIGELEQQIVALKAVRNETMGALRKCKQRIAELEIKVSRDAGEC